jgi:hypothetical protein
LTFALEPGWKFVESEDWKEDLHAGWAGFRADQSRFTPNGKEYDSWMTLEGWVYTNDAWQDARCQPLDEWYMRRMTRRRRWMRRIYYSSSV